jgi:hypothetical protein
MIHKAARAYAADRFGPDFWLAFADRLGLGDADFILSESYADELTFRLIGGLAEAADAPLDAFLREFGRYWVSFAGSGAYANLMAMGGTALPGFIRNLNRMHAGLAVAMPGARMPRFEVVQETADGFSVAYASSRQGLEPFVLGLMEGLCAWFEVEGEVSQTPEGGGRLFEIRYRVPVAA